MAAMRKSEKNFRSPRVKYTPHSEDRSANLSRKFGLIHFSVTQNSNEIALYEKLIYASVNRSPETAEEAVVSTPPQVLLVVQSRYDVHSPLCLHSQPQKPG